jgi:predicted SAM-dependent methyltransferase
MIWLWMTRTTTLLEEHPRLLHIAPEVSLMRHFKRLYKSDNYLTADLESPLADMHFDVQSIPLADNSIDVIICNHLLEHVEDDRQAMRELHRVLRPGGWAVVLVPEDRARATTFEDDTITDPKLRTELFGQYDHRRVYGRDYDERLRDAGFRVERIAVEHIATALFECHSDTSLVNHSPAFGNGFGAHITQHFESILALAHHGTQGDGYG